MGSRFGRSRRAPGDIQRELRAARPEPREDFVATLAGTMHRGSRFRWVRPAAALVLLCAGLAAFGAFGGLGYAADAISKTAGSASETLSLSSKAPAVDSHSPARDQYGGFGGCTPGYWKQSQHFFRWGGIPQTQSFNATFNVTPSQSGFANSFSLLDALKNGGGGIAALGRQGTAAYLNSRTPGMNYPYTTAQVIALVHDAIVSGNANTIESAKNTLEASNSLEGPLC
jgi:hypothetical protein